LDGLLPIGFDQRQRHGAADLQGIGLGFREGLVERDGCAEVEEAVGGCEADVCLGQQFGWEAFGGGEGVNLVAIQDRNGCLGSLRLAGNEDK